MHGPRRWARPAIALASAVVAHAALIALLGAFVEIGKATAPSSVPTVLLQGLPDRVDPPAPAVARPEAAPAGPAAAGREGKDRPAKHAGAAAQPSIVAVPEGSGPEPSPQQTQEDIPAQAGPDEAAVPEPPAGAAGAPGGEKGGQAAKAGDDVLEQIRAKLQASLVYPQVARLQGLEGTVQLRFSVAGDGTPTGVQVVGSSGFDVLDDAAVATLEKASPLPPVPVKIKVPVVYELK